jgi:hypothetical protein
MKTFLRAVGLALLASGLGCADFDEAELEFCERNPDRCGEVIRASVALPSVSATCVLFQIRNPSDGRVLEDRWLPRSGDELEVVVTRRALPGTVVLAARPYLGGDCQGGAVASTPNGPFETVTESFVQDTLIVTALRLRPGTDEDRDGYVSTGAGGADCADANLDVHPGAQEQCLHQEDRNCDGRKGCEAPACGANACTSPSLRLLLTVPASPVAAGTCTSATIQVKDANGFDTPVAATTPVSLQAEPTGSMTFFTDAACTTTAQGVTLSTGVARATFYFQGQIAGNVTITASAMGLAQDSKSVQLLAGTGNRLVFTTPGRTAMAGTCSQEVQLQSQDAQGNPAPVTVPTAVSLAASPATGFTFYSNSNCTTAVTSINLAAGTSSGSFYFRGTNAGTVTVSATMGGVPAATQNATITPGAPTALAFSQTSLTMTAGDCRQVILRSTDGFGNPSNVTSNQAISLAANPSGGFSFSTASNCSSTVTQVTIAASQNSVTLYVRGTVSGSVTVTASRTGFTNGTLTVAVNPAAPSRIEFQTAPQTVVVGACSAITTVRLLDAFSNVVTAAANTQINLAGSTGSIAFYSNAGCTSAVTSTTVPTGQSSASFYFKGTNAETVTITASSTGLTSASQTQTITPLTPTELAFTSAAQAVTVNACSRTATVEARASGTPTTVTTSTTVNLSAAPATGFTFYANSNCTTPVTSVLIAAGQSSTFFFFKGTTPGTVTLTASSPNLTSATQNASITPAPTKLQFTSPAYTVVANTCSPTVTVESSDTNDNAAPVATNTTVNLSQSGTPSDAQFRFFADSSCTTSVTSVIILAGQSEANFYYRGVQARSVTLTISASGLTSASQVHTITAAGLAPELPE